MSFKGVASPTKNEVNGSVNTTIFPATASEPKPATNPPEPETRAKPQSAVKQTASQSHRPVMSNIHKRIRFVNSDGPLVPMVRLVLIENDVIPMVLLVQNKFAFTPSKSLE